MKACTAGGTTTCLPSTGCCQDSDCTGPCQACSATSRTCVAAVNKDDPNGRCAGTCDATGACKSKRGQTCGATTGGCLSGSTCSPDGYCCDQECTASCLACDLPEKLGTCSPVTSGAPHGTRTACVGTSTTCGGACASRTDGACVYPTGNCGTGPMCDVSGASGQGTCSSGTCNVPMTVSCPNGCNTGSSACLSCAAGQMGCSGACKTLTTDVQNCGSCGNACKAPTLSVPEPGASFGAATCGGSCGWTCNSGFMKCPGTNPVCSRTSYDFEDGTTQGHYLRTDLGSNFGLTSVQNSTAKAHGGTHSLALTMRPGGGHVNLSVYICNGGTEPLPSSSRTISAWFYVAATALDVTMSNYLQLGLEVGTPAPSTFTITGGEVDTIALNTWTQIIAPVVTSVVSDASPYLDGFVFDGFIHQTGAATVYVDDIIWQ